MMSVIVVKIKNEANLPTLKQILAIFSKDISIMNDQEYRDSKFSVLLKEGRKSRIVPEEQTKQEFKKRGITI